ncbi:MAG: InlB B-repeat-containing protein, partial [Ruminococcus sp.]|nr:InlB B-repeat-containing protein [Ruminococcus sp.]
MKKKLRSSLSLLLSFVMVFSVFTIVPITASALDAVTYIDANGNEQACTEYTVLTNDIEKEISDGWYVINSDLEINILTCTGDVHLIVCDGCRLNDFSTSGSKHIVVNEGNSLNIYGQAEGTGQINVVGASYYAAIGSSGENINSGVITINGGTITAKGGGSIAKGLSSCIGGTLGGSGTVVINGGTIKTNTLRNMISIGGGGPAPLFGIVAAPGYVTINGGVFEELGSSGSRIGGIGDSTVKLNWNNLNTKITAKSYAGTVTIEKPFTDGTDIYAAGVVSDNSILSEKTLVPAVHTVTWNNDDGSAIDTTIVAYGEAPTHDAPTKPEDENNTYTFAGWNDGTSTYAPDALPEVTGDVTYTAQFNAVPKPHTHDGITFEPWTSTNSMPSTAGNYYLTQDLTIHSEWRAPEGTTRICLNGHKITTYEHFLMVSGTALEIYDEEGGGSMDAVYRVGSMFWVKGGKFVLNGGTINGNVSTAGIVDIAANATFTMNGGTLTGRAVNRYDACGIRFTGSGGTFNMNGGEITGLSAVAGVTYFEKSDVTVNISGNSKIYGNTLINGTTRNLYLSENAAVNVGELGSDATIGVTMQTPGVFTNSTDISNNDASKFFSDKSDYIVGKNADGQLVLGVPRTVTWLNDDGTTIDTTTVADGAVPTHEAPTKLGNNFAGWKNGETTYAPNALPNVSGDVTYTATFTPKKLISNCNLTLDGDIIINFNIDPSSAGLTPENIGSGKELTVTFEWAKDFSNASDKPKTDITKYSKTITVDSSNVGSKIPVTCPVCAAEMSCRVKATATLNGTTETKEYSVRDYADSVLAPREGSNFEKMKNENPTQYNKLADLVTTMVDYGAKAQQVFNINIDDPAN